MCIYPHNHYLFPIIFLQAFLNFVLHPGRNESEWEVFGSLVLCLFIYSIVSIWLLMSLDYWRVEIEGKACFGATWAIITVGLWRNVLVLRQRFHHDRLCLPGRLGAASLPSAGWQVSLVWEACLCGGEDLCRGALLPPGVLSLFDLQLRSTTGSTWLRLGTRLVFPVSVLAYSDVMSDICWHLTGKLYCKLHFEQRHNGRNQRRSFCPSSVGALLLCPIPTLFAGNSLTPLWRRPFQKSRGLEVRERYVAEEERSQSTSAADRQSPPAAGTVTRKRLRWPLKLTRAVCNGPRYLSHRVCGAARALAGHWRNNAQDYAFLYELLSTSLPLLFVLQEVLLQMYSETAPDGPSSLQPLLLWLQEEIGQRLI